MQGLRSNSAQSISKPIVKIVAILTPSALVHGLWAPVSPGPIKLFIHIWTYICLVVFVRPGNITASRAG